MARDELRSRRGCQHGFYCVAPNRLSNGQPGADCTSADTCASGHCVDGVCCDSECSGQCEACNQSFAKGTCTAVVGAPIPPHPACLTDTTVCGGSCDGVTRNTCTYPDESKLCVPGYCAGGVWRAPASATERAPAAESPRRIALLTSARARRVEEAAIRISGARRRITAPKAGAFWARLPLMRVRRLPKRRMLDPRRSPPPAVADAARPARHLPFGSQCSQLVRLPAGEGTHDVPTAQRPHLVALILCASCGRTTLLDGRHADSDAGLPPMRASPRLMRRFPCTRSTSSTLTVLRQMARRSTPRWRASMLPARLA